MTKNIKTATTHEEADMSTKHLMNPDTGSVDTGENWLAEMPSWDEDGGKTREEQFASLIEVEKDDAGDWVEFK